MEDFASRVELDPEPRSATTARAWTRDTLREIDRDELAESATAGVSELVTNGILHAQTTISLVLQTFGDRVVVTVTDRSPVHTQARLSPDAPRDDDATVGRGLRIVRAHSQDWGVVSSQHGKSIWFVPTEAPNPVALGSFPELELLGEEEPAEETVGGPVTEVRMAGTPVAALQILQDRWTELVRELQLISLGQPSPLQAVAEELGELDPLTRATRWLTAASTKAISTAIDDSVDRVDLALEVPAGARNAFARTLHLVRELDRTSQREQLLNLSGGTRMAQLREWWLGEVVRQLDGKPPRPWHGDYAVVDASVGRG